MQFPMRPTTNFPLGQNEATYPIESRPRGGAVVLFRSPGLVSLARSATELKDHVDGGAGGNIVGVEGLVVGTEREEWRDES